MTYQTNPMSSGFRELNAEELAAVSGGIDVIGNVNPPGSITPEELALTNSTLGSTPVIVVTANLDEEAPDADYNSYTVIPFFPFVIDTTVDDFKEFLVNQKSFTADEAEREIIVTAKLGNQNLIVHWNGLGRGAIYIVDENMFTDDSFKLFSQIKNVNFSLSSGTTSTINQSGGSLQLSDGYTITFERVSS